MKYITFSFLFFSIICSSFGEGTNWLSSINTNIEEQEYEAAIHELNNVIIEREQALYLLYKLRADCYFSIGKYKEAEVEFRKILSESRRGVYEFYIGKCLLYQKKYKGAKEMFDSAYNNLPENDLDSFKFQYQYHLLFTLYKMDLYDDANELYSKLKANFPAEDMSEVHKFRKSKNGTGSANEKNENGAANEF